MTWSTPSPAWMRTRELLRVHCTVMRHPGSPLCELFAVPGGLRPSECATTIRHGTLEDNRRSFTAASQPHKYPVHRVSKPTQGHDETGLQLNTFCSQALTPYSSDMKQLATTAYSSLRKLWLPLCF